MIGTMWLAGMLMTLTLAAEPLTGTLQLRGLRWAPEKQSDVEECSLTDAQRLELVELIGHLQNRDKQPLWGLMAEIRLRWQEGPDHDATQALWTPWMLVDTKRIALVNPFSTFFVRTRLDVEGRRLALKKRNRWPYTLQVQLAVRRNPAEAPVFVKTATLPFPAPTGPTGAADPAWVE